MATDDDLPFAMGPRRPNRACHRQRCQAIEISCGISDEGDPWCVSSRIEISKVLAHFARIDGTYVGHWEGFSGTRSSDCLDDLTDDFLRSCSKISMF